MTASPRLTLEEARRRHDAAREELSRLCHGGRFRMTIPAQPDDSDVILGDALQALKALIEGHDLVPRDDTAELVEALARVLDKVAWGEDAGCRDCGAWGYQEHQPDCAVGRAEAVLARVKEQR